MFTEDKSGQYHLRQVIKLHKNGTDYLVPSDRAEQEEWLIKYIVVIAKNISGREKSTNYKCKATGLNKNNDSHDAIFDP